eukprot:1041830_1
MSQLIDHINGSKLTLNVKRERFKLTNDITSNKSEHIEQRMNPMMRASSAMFTPTNRHSFSPNQNPYTHNKIGLFDGDSLMTSQLGATPRFRADVKDSVGSGCDFLERDRFFLESKYKSRTFDDEIKQLQS